MFKLILITLPVTGWLSYYLSAKVYKGLAKEGQRNARLVQVLSALGIFVLLTVLIIYFVVSSVQLGR